MADEDLCPALVADGSLPPILRAFPETKSDHDEGNGAIASTAEMREKFESDAYEDAFNAPEPMVRMLLTKDEFGEFKKAASEYAEARYLHAHVAHEVLNGFTAKHPGVTNDGASNESALLLGIRSYYDKQLARFSSAVDVFREACNKFAPLMHERLTALEGVLATNAEAFFKKMWKTQFGVTRETAHKTIVGYENLGEVVEDAVSLLTGASASCGRIERGIAALKKGEKDDSTEVSEKQLDDLVEDLKDTQRLAKALGTSFVMAVVDTENAIDKERHAKKPSVWLPMDLDALQPQKASAEKSVPEAPKNTTNSGLRPV